MLAGDFGPWGCTLLGFNVTRQLTQAAYPTILCLADTVAGRLDWNHHRILMRVKDDAGGRNEFQD